MTGKIIECDVAVLGAGPGGYSAAFRAADLGKKVVLIERYDTLGGVCLNVGCIPSKALLHAAKVIDDAAEMKQYGIDFGKPKLNIDKLRDWKNSVVKKLTDGLTAMAKMRKVEVVHGFGKFISANEIQVEGKDNLIVKFTQCIIAVGSRVVKLPFIPEDPRIMDSTDALNLEDTTANMLVIGGGIIGLEMATVYRALGAKITIVEFMNQLMPGAEKDVVAPYAKFVENHYDILLETKVTAIDAKKDGLYVRFEGKHAPEKPVKFDRILVAVGRRPNGDLIAAEKAGVKVNERGFIEVDSQMRSNISHIFAIGDVVGNPMLAHKSVPQGRLAAEVIAGKKYFFTPKCIPAVAYTDPEVAWTGMTVDEAKAKGIDAEVSVFPYVASGRALAMARSEGMTKLIFNKDNHQVIGGAIVGPNAGDLISEISLAVEMACDVEDIALTIHPHPTLAESIMIAAEIYEGTVTDLPNKKKK